MIAALQAYRSLWWGWCLCVGGGWLLVEMCIVDASILFSAWPGACCGFWSLFVVEVV
jgi:hypothetical protein